MMLANEDEMYRKLSSLFDRMMKRLFREEGSQLRIDLMADPEVQAFIEEHAGILDSSFSEVRMSDTMRSRLQESDYIFSGIKTFHELNQAFPSLLDDNGDRKPFQRFLNDVRSIDSTYNRNYLRAEYNFCQASAGMAARWEQIEADGDRYLLQYRTAADDKVREEHAALHGITLPPSDSFWKTYYPPNGWNCRCTAVQVRRGKHPETPHDEAMKRALQATEKDKKGIFQFNSGQQRKAFPDYNPYTISRCRDCDIAQGKLSLAYVPENELCAACKLLHECEAQRYDILKEYSNGGRIKVHQLVNHSDSDYQDLITVADHFAKKGSIVLLTPKLTRPRTFVYENIFGSLKGTIYEGSCPDLMIDGKWYELKGYTTANPKRALSNMLNKALKQSDRIIIERPGTMGNRYIRHRIEQRIKQGDQIEEVWIKEKDGVLTQIY